MSRWTLDPIDGVTLEGFLLTGFFEAELPVTGDLSSLVNVSFFTQLVEY